MMLLQNATDKATNKPIMMTHDIDRNSSNTKPSHVLRFYHPKVAAGLLAGELIATYVLSADQAAELKAHL